MDSLRKISHLKKNFYAALKELTQNTSPWDRWKVIMAYPDASVLDGLEKLLVYIQQPVHMNVQLQQGGGLGLGHYQIIIGGWCDRVNGGQEEIDIFASVLLEWFLNPEKWAQVTYDVSTDQDYTDTTLFEQGIMIDSIVGPNTIIQNVSDNEFRYEFTINFRS